MRCRIAQDLASRRLDGALPPRAATALAAHLAACPGCALAAARLERAWARLAALPPPSPAPDDFAAVLLRSASRRGWRERLDVLLPPRPLRLAWAGALAAGVLVGVTAGVTLGRAVFRPTTAGAAPEAVALAEGFGLLPFGSPAAALDRALAGGTGGRE